MSCYRIVREEGAGALYNGFQVNLVRVVPMCAITFTSYEMMSQALGGGRGTGGDEE